MFYIKKKKVRTYKIFIKSSKKNMSNKYKTKNQLYQN